MSSGPSHVELAYRLARLAQQYGPTPAGFAALVANPGFQTLGLQSIGNGRVRMPDGQIIDMIRGYSAGGSACVVVASSGDRRTRCRS